MQHVRLFLRHLLEQMSLSSLFVKAEKFEFQATTVSFLEFIIQQGQLLTKIQAVAEWPTPTTRRQLQQFQEFANFYWGLIQGYSKVAAPLTGLASLLYPFARTEEAEAILKCCSIPHLFCLSQIQPVCGGGCL